MPPARYRAPAADGAVLADPPQNQWADVVARNQRLANPLADLKRQARAEVLAAVREQATLESPGTIVPGLSPTTPLLLTGHQPELMHPGVWVKTFALSGLAARTGGLAVNLVADHDTLKAVSVRVPVWATDPAAVRVQSVRFDALAGEQPFETRTVRDGAVFRTFADRVAGLTGNWPFEPLLPAAWACVTHRPGTVGDRFTAARKCFERQWGCQVFDLPVSRLSRTGAFRRFVRLVAADLPRFRGAYNAAVRAYRERHGIRNRSHPVPDLAEGEMPFWGPADAAGRRGRATPASDDVRPRALTLTLFARLCLGDFFLHGIGGGKYDEVTDALLAGFFAAEPPGYGVLTATAHLPLPGFGHDAAAVRELRQQDRAAYWSPERHGPADPGLVSRKRELLAAEPTGRAERRAWFRAVRTVGDQLRAAAPPPPDRRREEQEAAANRRLRRRDFAWVLHPEATLRPFLQGFL